MVTVQLLASQKGARVSLYAVALASSPHMAIYSSVELPEEAAVVPSPPAAEEAGALLSAPPEHPASIVVVMAAAIKIETNFFIPYSPLHYMSFLITTNLSIP